MTLGKLLDLSEKFNFPEYELEIIVILYKPQAQDLPHSKSSISGIIITIIISMAKSGKFGDKQGHCIFFNNYTEQQA